MIVLKQIFNLLQQTIIIAPPILITAVGACISEKSGVVNIGLEGIMLSSAFATAVVNIATGNPYWGIIFGVIVFVFAQAFNIFLSFLSAYVHTSRLMYVEYFGKFYEGGGKPFKDFRTENKYINLDD